MRAVVVFAVVLCLAAGCSSGSGDGARGVYVALGDSFSSGEGNPPYEAGTDVEGNDCHRSDRAFPNLVAARLDLDLRFRACSGARTVDLAAPQFPSQPPQLDGLDDDTAIVTITIGGNDTEALLLLGRCLFVMALCRNDGGRLDQQIASLGPLVTQHLVAVKARVPDASVWLVGYPQLLPAVGGAGRCASLGVVGLTHSDQDLAFFRAKSTQLGVVMRTAAEAAGVGYVDTENAFAGHEVCTVEPWVVGVSAVNRDGALHPNAEGQRALADAVASAIGRTAT